LTSIVKPTALSSPSPSASRIRQLALRCSREASATNCFPPAGSHLVGAAERERGRLARSHHVFRGAGAFLWHRRSRTQLAGPVPSSGRDQPQPERSSSLCRILAAAHRTGLCAELTLCR